MKFTEEKAKEIAELFSLSDLTVNTWRHRGSIPEKYKDAVPEEITKADKALIDKVVNALKNEKWNIDTIVQLSSVKLSRIKDLRRDQYTPSVQEATDLKKAINDTRIKIKNVIVELQGKKNFSDIQEKKLKEICSLDSIHLQKVLSTMPDRKKVGDWTLGKTNLSPQNCLSIIDCFAVFILETSV